MLNINPNKWIRIRKYHLEKYIRALRKGEVDKPIVPLLDLLNEIDEDIVTTSSCYGRILLLKTKNIGEKSIENIYRKWHHPADINEIWKVIEEYDDTDLLWLLLQSTIIHIKCRTLEKAIWIRNMGIQAGYKYSKILSISDKGITVEISGTERLNMPIKKGSVLYINPEIRELIKNLYLEMFDRIEKRKVKFIELLKNKNL